MSDLLEDQIRYVIVDSETGEMWYSEVYNNTTGAKTSFFHASRYYDRTTGTYKTIRFDDQTKYKLIKVKLVPLDE
jgi:hypothetical protein